MKNVHFVLDLLDLLDVLDFDGDNHVREEIIDFIPLIRIIGESNAIAIRQTLEKLGLDIANMRSSRPEMFCKKGVLRNFTKFTGKHQCQSLFFNKVAALRPATLLKKRLWHWCFPVNFAKFLRTAFFTEHLWWLLL